MSRALLWSHLKERFQLLHTTLVPQIHDNIARYVRQDLQTSKLCYHTRHPVLLRYSHKLYGSVDVVQVFVENATCSHTDGPMHSAKAFTCPFGFLDNTAYDNVTIYNMTAEEAVASCCDPVRCVQHMCTWFEKSFGAWQEYLIHMTRKQFLLCMWHSDHAMCSAPYAATTYLIQLLVFVWITTE